MDKKYFTIEGIPAVLWGSADSSRLVIAVHGDQSHKEDHIIQILAEEALKKGCQVLSFDLPEHGARTKESRPCKPDTCVEDLNKVFRYANTRCETISLFGCSIGAYFGMLAYRDQKIEQALFVSPVVDMKRIIDNMMTWFGISAQQLKLEKVIVTPAKTLYWDYYQYVLAHPVVWNKNTALLYGRNDNLCEYDCISRFVKSTRAEITVLEDGEHFFQTVQQLSSFREWLSDHISS